MSDPLYEITRHIKACGDNAPKLQQILDENKELFAKAKGSQHNHQAWPGGYLQHVADCLTIAQHIYSMEWQCPFSWSSVVLVLFLHDKEKPFMQIRMAADPEMQLWTHNQRSAFRRSLVSNYNLVLTEEEELALYYIHGEGDQYSPTSRTMNELGALCHAADVLSARLWPNRNMPAQLRQDELDLLSPPGATIKETMEELGIDLPVFCLRMNLAIPEAYQLLKGDMVITTQLADRLEGLFNIDAQFWLNLEANYRRKLRTLNNASENSNSSQA